MSPDLVAGVLGGVFALVALVGVFALVRLAARGERIERPEVGPWVGHPTSAFGRLACWAADDHAWTLARPFPVDGEAIGWDTIGAQCSLGAMVEWAREGERWRCVRCGREVRR